jgi:phytoene/squalene synthetase
VACVAVYGSDDVERAATLGVALQLINIIRDVREDWELGRVYLPQDEIAAYGVTEDEIAEMAHRDLVVRCRIEHAGVGEHTHVAQSTHRGGQMANERLCPTRA